MSSITARKLRTPLGEPRPISPASRAGRPDLLPPSHPPVAFGAAILVTSVAYVAIHQARRGATRQFHEHVPVIIEQRNNLDAAWERQRASRKERILAVKGGAEGE